MCVYLPSLENGNGALDEVIGIFEHPPIGFDWFNDSCSCSAVGCSSITFDATVY